MPDNLYQIGQPAQKQKIRLSKQEFERHYQDLCQMRIIAILDGRLMPCEGLDSFFEQLKPAG